MIAREGYVATTDGVRLFFQAVGEAPQVALVPNGHYLIDELAQLAKHRTMVFFDLRNRGRSDAVPPGSSGRGGILQDADDVVAVARHFTDGRVGVIGHSFAGLLAALCAMQYPDRIDRVVQIAPMAPRPDSEYPAHLTNRDAVFADVMARLAVLQSDRANHEPEEFCRKVWDVLRPLYVTDARNADRISWVRCHLPNERASFRYFMEHTVPSIRALDLGPEPCARVTGPVLIIHGTLDRSAPYGGGRDWAARLPDARLVTVVDAGHAPWVEQPSLVLDVLKTFLSGEWPQEAERVGESRSA